MGLLPRTKSIALLALLAVLVSLGAYGFFMHRVLKISEGAAALSVSIGAQSDEDRELRTLGKLMAELQEEEYSLNARFVSEGGVVSFIELLEDLGSDAGVVVEITSVGIEAEGEGNSPLEWLKVSLRTKGSWQKTIHFVRFIETLPFVAKLDTVSLLFSAEEGALGGNLWAGTFVIKAGKLVEPEL